MALAQRPNFDLADYKKHPLADWYAVKILAIETTEAIASVAVADDDNVLLELHLDTHKRSAQSLAPGLKRVLEQVGWRPADVQLVAVTIGPGSFTGLRVGLTTAKIFAYAVGAEVLGVDTLDVIAAGSPSEVTDLAVAVDAQRGDVVARTYHRASDGRFEPLGPAELLPMDAWLAGLAAGMAVSGPVLAKWTEDLPPGVVPVERRFWPPTAGNVARLASRLYAAGHRDDLWKLAPHYSRPSGAEEKWAQRGK